MPEPISIRPVTTRTDWDTQVRDLGGHPLQLWGWGEVKAAGAWTPHRIAAMRAGQIVGLAQVLVRKLPVPFSALSYVPRGPVVRGDADDPDAELRSAVAEAVVDWARSTVGGIGITLEPDWPKDAVFELHGSRPAANPVLYASTLILDLRRTPDELLSVMAKKTRQYIRKSSREDIEFRPVSSDGELDACLAIYRETAVRAGFGLHDDDYYRLVARELGDDSPIFAAFARSTDDGPHDRPIAFVWFAASAETSFELYGGMNADGQRLRANYGLKWYAINAMRDRGVHRYDVNGLLNDGISNFKRGFADHEDELIGSIDVPFSVWYGPWNRGLPAAKRLVRRVRGGRQGDATG